MNPLPRRRRSRRAFTLIEVLVTIALIGGLLALIVVNFGGIFEGGQRDTVKQYVSGTLDLALTKYRLDTGSYPTTEEGLQALMTAPAGKGARWRGPYVTRLDNDPWGNPYQYRFPGVKNTHSYDLFSLGPDGQEGTADDIGNW